MRTKTKRTYNISADTLATVKYLVDERHVAPTQDALVERAIEELARQIRDLDDARLWAQAAEDQELQAELAEWDALFAEDDARAWDR